MTYQTRKCRPVAISHRLLRHHLLLLLLVAACMAQAPPCVCNTSAVWDALAALHRSTGGATWLRKHSWLLVGSSVCEWYGVRCTDLELSSNNLTGTLPVNLSLLSATTFISFDFSNNSISGTLPSQLAALSQIQVLHAYTNSLSGTLPPAYANWTQLRELSVGNNSISGSLPPEYASWSQIIMFYVYNNRLSGTLPLVYANWTQLRWMDVHSNNISGQLPPEYASWSQINMFYVYTNRLSGTLPSTYANWTELRWLSVADNNIFGQLPPEYASWSRIELFYVNTNCLSGTLPSTYANWTELRWLHVHTNNITGSLPPEYASWIRIELIFANMSGLSGTLPPAYASWTQLVHLYAHGNNIFGSLPPEYASWSRIRVFSVYANRLTGTLPPVYANWTGLRELSVYKNNISGTLPSEFSAWVTAETMIFGENLITGTIPPAYGTLNNLNVLVLSANQLSGTVPMLRVRQLLALNDNPQLSGTLPASMGLSLFVVLCNTSICGRLPLLWTAGFTRSVCLQLVDLTTNSRDQLMTELLSAPLYALPSCSRPVAPASAAPSRVIAVLRSLSIAGDAAGAVGVAAAALAAGSSGGAMQLSLRTAVIAKRVAQCRSDEVDDAGDAESAAVGALVADNPLRVSVPGSLPLTVGAVLGNTLLLVAVPLLLVALAHLPVLGVTRPADRAMTWSAHGLQLVWSVVQVPTVAASVLLAVETARAAMIVSGAVGGVGCAVCGSMAALTVSCWVRVRGCEGRRQPLHANYTGTRGVEQPPCTVRLRQLLLHPRSTWSYVMLGNLRNVTDSRAQQVARGVSAVHTALAHLLLSGCLYPHSWVIVYDAAAGVLAGVLVGVASTPHVSCEVVSAAAWAAFGAAAVQAVVAVAVRPRCTVAECVFDAVMCTWTAVGALLAALGIEEGSEESAVAQGALALLCAVPTVGLRVHRLRCAEKTGKIRHSSERRRASPTPHPTPTPSTRSPARVDRISRDEALRSVVQRICSAHQRHSAIIAERHPGELPGDTQRCWLSSGV